MHRRPWTILDYGDRVYLRDADGDTVTEIQPAIQARAWGATQADRLGELTQIIFAQRGALDQRSQGAESPHDVNNEVV